MSYCKHNVYVGGSGVDYMCNYCESGFEPSAPLPRVSMFVFGKGYALKFLNIRYVEAQQQKYGLEYSGLTVRLVPLKEVD